MMVFAGRLVVVVRWNVKTPEELIA